MLKKRWKKTIFEFLTGLNEELGQVRVQVLGKKKLPSMNEVISIICAEKSWKGVMLEPSSIDGFAMVVESQTNSTQILLEKQGILMVKESQP